MPAQPSSRYHSQNSGNHTQTHSFCDKAIAHHYKQSETVLRYVDKHHPVLKSRLLKN